MSRRLAARILATVTSLALVVGGVLVATPAYAEAPGSISGVVTDLTGAPIADVGVDVFLVGGPEDAASVSTAADGSYTVDGLPAGDYRVSFTPFTAHHFAEWWNDAASAADAAAITVGDGVAVTGIDPVLARAGSIAGVVSTSGGDPVAGLEVIAYRMTPAGPAWAQSASTGADGGYTLPELRAGDYVVSFGEDEPPAGLARQWWNDADAPDAATPITVADGAAITGIDPLLVASGTVSGTVTSPTAVGVAGVEVLIYAADDAVGDVALGSAVTDEDGRYALSGVAAGEYLVHFDASGASGGLAGEWWQNAASRSGATAVTLPSGAAVRGIDAQLALGARVEGTVTGADGLPLVGVDVHVYPATGADKSVAVSQTTTAEDGTYAAIGLAAGDYVVSFGEASAPEGTLSEWWDGAETRAAATTLTASGSAILAGIDAELDPAGSITGVVKDVNDDVIAGLEVIAYRVAADDALTWTATATTAADGSYEIEGLWVGSYVLSFGELATPGNVIGEWWKDAATSGTATDIVVDAGVNVGDISPTLGLTPLTVAKPIIGGSPQVGKVLTASAAPAGQTYAYVWKAAGGEIPGATARTLTLTAAQLGKAITVQVMASAPGWSRVTVNSNATPKVILGVLVAPTPKITGTLAVGGTVTAVVGTWAPKPRLQYQWYANGRVISGATASTFRLTTAQLSTQLSVRVVGSLAGYTNLVKYSAKTARVTLSGTPTVTGTASVGSRLTAKPGTWLTGTTLYYQWLADGVAISGATKATFTVGYAQRGKALTVRVLGKKSGYASVLRYSKATLRVPTVTTPKITGTAVVTRVLTAVPGTWTTGTVFSYQWYANGAAVSGATKSSLTLTKGLIGKKITVRVTGRKSGYTTVVRNSAATAAVSSR